MEEVVVLYVVFDILVKESHTGLFWAEVDHNNL